MHLRVSEVPYPVPCVFRSAGATQVEDSCKERCLEDLASTTRYVSWSLHTRNSRSLKQLLGRVRVTGSDSSSSCGGSHPISTGGPGAVSKAGGAMGAGAPGAGLSREPSMTGGVGGGQAGSLSLPDMLEATLWNRNLTGVSEDIVRALVLQMFEGIRDHLVQVRACVRAYTGVYL
ncbi:hypothetical protein HYH02_015566 [Chlamydomonas schloesseri]|uniref:Uncharacterized protein n=1 Tax=Chlamydomonas schloesseri TaxID=2026947 RepID=A0A835S748_9CHLO|nr:hypothetical protein HYH02_015566 [Chlamydomonas schloesseri]|eukprot:KAG2421973.1 hypothetical protein HYH02_015566 [Chlamydomonas schloesseri]